MPFSHLQPVDDAGGDIKPNHSVFPIDERTNFDALRAELDHADSRVRSFVVVRNNMRVFEHFRLGATPYTLEEVNSVTKSVVAMAVGIALKEGLLPHLDTPIAEFLPLARDAAVDPRARRITVRHLLDMTSGFAWDAEMTDECVLGACERFDDDAGDHSRLRFLLTRTFASDPGGPFAYDSHAVHLLSHVVERAAGRTLARYVAEKLFAPLGIGHHEWIGDEAGHSFAARGLALRTRDMAKLGVLMSHRGKWRGTQVIDADFVADALSVHSEGGPPMQASRYGYLWWIRQRYVFAAGFGGQFIFISRDGNVVAAATSERDEANLRAMDLFEEHVLGPTD